MYVTLPLEVQAMSKMILIIEDEESIQNIIRAFLEDAGYTVVLAADGLEGIEQFRANKPDLVLLDLMLPKIDGFAVCEILRKESHVPIIMLTALDDDDSQMKGFDALADDYITKPFGTSELLARIRTSLRHSNRMASNSPLYIRPYKCQGLILDFEKRMLTLDGEEIHLTPVEYKIVAYLARNSGKVMTYASVMANVWGPFTDNNNRILRVNMANIRRKIERNPSQPQFLFTEVGVGYRMCEDENEV